MGIYAELSGGRDLQSVTHHQLHNPKKVTAQDALEERAIEMADLVIAHSDINLHLYTSLYAGHAGKVYNKVVWFSEWIFREARQYQSLAKPFGEREVDVLFIANDWSRKVKGFRLVKKIISRLHNCEAHVVGELPEPLGVGVHHDFIADRKALFRLMANTRVVVSTSLYDAAPGVLFEAAVMGCNIVASKNCGNWALCHSDLLVEPATARAFAGRITLAKSRAFPSHIEHFSETGSYEDLKDLLMVF